MKTIRYEQSFFKVRAGKRVIDVAVLHVAGEDKRREKQQRLAEDYGGMHNVKFIETKLYKEIESK